MTLQQSDVTFSDPSLDSGSSAATNFFGLLGRLRFTSDHLQERAIDDGGHAIAKHQDARRHDGKVISAGTCHGKPLAR